MSRKLKDWLTSFLEYTSEEEPCEAYRTWTGVSMIAAALQRKCHFVFGTQKIYPNFYLVLTGPSGWRKTTAILLGSRFPKEVGVPLAADVTSKERLIIALEEVGAKETGLNEAFLSAPIDPHSSLTAVADELTIFFPENDQGFVSYMLKLYDCQDSFDYQTKTKGDNHIDNVFFNLIGGMTPDEVHRRLTPEVIGAGLLGRLTFIQGMPPVRNAHPSENTKLYNALLHDYREIFSLWGGFKPTPQWVDAYVPWYEDPKHGQEFSGTPLEAYSSRRGNQIKKLSMIMAASRQDADKMQLRAVDFERARELMEGAEALMLDAVSGLGASDEGILLNKVISVLQAVKKITLTNLIGRFAHLCNQNPRRQLLEIILTLEDMGKVDIRKIKGNLVDLQGNDILEISIRYREVGE